MPDVKRMSETVSPVVAASRAAISAVVDVRAAGEEPVPGERALGRVAAQHDDRVERRHRVAPREQVDVVGVEEVGDGEQQLGVRAVEDVRRFVALEPRVHRHDHAAGAVDAERGDDPLGDVGRPDRDAVAGLDAGRDERARGDARGVARAPRR